MALEFEQETEVECPHCLKMFTTSIQVSYEPDYWSNVMVVGYFIWLTTMMNHKAHTQVGVVVARRWNMTYQMMMVGVETVIDLWRMWATCYVRSIMYRW